MNKIGIYNTKVENLAAGYGGVANIKTMAGACLNYAGTHALESNFGITNLIKHGHTWVLARLHIKMNRLAVCGENLKIETWISSINGAMSERKFVFYCDDELIGTASSMWVVLDINTRQGVSIADNKIIGDIATQRDIEIEDSERVRCTDSLEIAKHKVKYSDLDINNHVNSLKYIEWILDTIDLEQHKNEPFHEILINYQYEVMYNEDVSLRKSQKREHTYDIYNSSGINTTKIRFRI